MSAWQSRRKANYLKRDGRGRIRGVSANVPNLLSMVKNAYSAGNNQMVFHGAILLSISKYYCKHFAEEETSQLTLFS